MHSAVLSVQNFAIDLSANQKTIRKKKKEKDLVCWDVYNSTIYKLLFLSFFHALLPMDKCHMPLKQLAL